MIVSLASLFLKDIVDFAKTVGLEIYRGCAIDGVCASSEVWKDPDALNYPFSFS